MIFYTGGPCCHSLFLEALSNYIDVQSRSASTVFCECNRQVSEHFCWLNLCHLGETAVLSQLLLLGGVTYLLKCYAWTKSI